MAHAGTIDLGKERQAKAAPGGGGMLAVGLTVVIAVATIAAVWFATSSGLKSGTTTAKPVEDHRFDQIELRRGALTLGSARGDYDANLDDWMERPVGTLKPVGTLGSADRAYFDENLGAWMEQPVGTLGSQGGYYDSNLGVWMEQPVGTLGSQGGFYDSTLGVWMAQPVGTIGSQGGFYDSNLGVWMGQPVGTIGSDRGFYDANLDDWMERPVGTSGPR